MSTFVTSNIVIDFKLCSSCNGFWFTMGEDFLLDNTKIFTIDTFNLKIGETSFDLINSIVKLIDGSSNTIAVPNGSATVTGTNTLFESEFSKGDYIGVKTATSNRFYKILSIASDTSLTLTEAFVDTTVTTSAYYKINYNVSVESAIADGLYKVYVDFKATDASAVQQEYNLITEQLFFCNAQCCLDKMFAMLPGKLCDTCNTEQFIKDLMTVQSLVEALKYAVCCPDDAKIKSILAMITKICNYNNCTTC